MKQGKGGLMNIRWQSGLLICCFAVLLVVAAILPLPSFDRPLSAVTLAEDGRLLGAHIADDEQWRFPPGPSLNDKYIIALINYEDRCFYGHPGLNPVSLLRSLYLNLKHGEIVSGGSTISMQLARMSGDNPPRTVPRKLLEIFMALKMELFYSKDEILSIYAANAPFGGNVIGIEAASWRYFGRQPHELSWAEACMLAVLPNAPSLIYPGVNEPRLKNKRDKLLRLLYERGVIDDMTLELAMDEKLPDRIHDLPSMAAHIISGYTGRKPGGRYITTIDHDLQENVLARARRHHDIIMQNGVHNIAAVVVEVESGRMLARVGNVSTDGQEHGGSVDMIRARRSTGSILKPFLYAAMLESGELLPEMLVPDVPVEFGGYSPKNFNLEYNGAVHASDALRRSLNIPAVEMLLEYSPARFLLFLKDMGFTTFNRDADNYGLSLILGGGEACLRELVGAYAHMVLRLKHPDMDDNTAVYAAPYYDVNDREMLAMGDAMPLSPASVWFTFKALRDVNRPEQRAGWEHFASSGQLAWKTGTSYGYRDAWAIGFNSEYVVGVWAGNADGEGRAGLTGLRGAAPLLFDIFDLLDGGEWFEMPTAGMSEVEICLESGHRAGPLCTNTAMRMIPRSGELSRACSYHKMVHLSSDREYRVTDECYSTAAMEHVSFFVLPPSQEWYYRKQHPSYQDIPRWMPGCDGDGGDDNIELLYPRNTAGLYIPLEHDGSRGRIVFEAAVRDREEKLFWHLDDRYMGETQLIHQMGMAPVPGEHVLTLVDSRGNRLVKTITVLGVGTEE
ncbi:MAG: penicillin-binding protein 1C [Bacteroidales bacterium]